LLFCSIFVLLAFNFLRAFFRSGADESSLVYLFIPAFGIFCYSFDAFFNFPADRPEIQSVFAMFIGAGIAFSAVPARDGKAGASWLRISLSAVMILLLAVSSFVLLLNYKSLVIQRYVQEDQITDTLRSSTGLLVAGYPFIPTVTTLAEPIAVQKARYLINDGKYQEAIDILRPDRSSPYDGRREMFITMAYSKMGNVDSALVYAWRVRDLKPLNFSSLDYICKVFESLGNKEEALKLLREFILVEKDTPEAWQHIATLFWETGQYQMAVDAIDSASVHLPKDTLIRKLKVKLANDIIVQPFMAQYSAAMECLSKRNYPEAQKYLDEIISKETRIAMVYAGRAYCYYTSRLYDKCLGDIKRTMELGNSTPDLFNLRGLSYIGLGNNDAACKDFKTAAERGDRDGAANFRRFCK
jgi:tetratricopeptide (TPR) repeat protein